MATFRATKRDISRYPVLNALALELSVYVDSNDGFHGFIRRADGTVTPFDPPGSTTTFATSINGIGAIAGYYEDNNDDSHGIPHGILRSR